MSNSDNSDVEKFEAVSVSHLKDKFFCFFFFFAIDFFAFLFSKKIFVDPLNEYLVGSGFRFLEVVSALTSFSELQDSESIHILN